MATMMLMPTLIMPTTAMMAAAVAAIVCLLACLSSAKWYVCLGIHGWPHAAHGQGIGVLLIVIPTITEARNLYPVRDVSDRGVSAAVDCSGLGRAEHLPPPKPPFRSLFGRLWEASQLFRTCNCMPLFRASFVPRPPCGCVCVHTSSGNLGFHPGVPLVERGPPPQPWRTCAPWP